MSESTAGLRLPEVLMRIHVFIYLSCQLFNLSGEHSPCIEIYLHNFFKVNGHLCIICLRGREKSDISLQKVY